MRTLREQAEARITEHDLLPVEKMSPAEIKELIHDYQVHQFELQIQNEELRRTQNLLEQARDRFDQLFNVAPVGYLVLEDHGVILQVNETFANMVGLPVQKIHGQSLSNFLSPEDRKIFLGRFRAFFRSPDGKVMDLALAGVEGVLPVRCIGRREYGAMPSASWGEQAFLLLILSDIRGQVAAEEALRRSEERNRAMLRAVPDAMFLHCRSGAYLDCRSSNPDQLPASPETLSGKRLDEVLPLDLAEEMLGRFADAMASGETQMLEYELDQGLGKRVFEARITPVDAQQLLTIVRDVTQQRKMEDVLLRREREFRGLSERLQLELSRREHLEELKDNVARIVRHDLKSPLNAVINLPSLIAESETLSDHGLEMLSMISISGHKMLNLLNESVQLYKLEAGDYTFQGEWLELDQEIHRVGQEVEHLLRRKRIQLHIEHGKHGTEQMDTSRVYGDKAILPFLLSNLIKNAVEAAPEDTTVTVRVAMDLPPERHEPEIRLELHNWGTVPEAIRSTFFEKYATHGKPDGTGLGTYSAMLIAQAHRGTIAMTTSDERGTTITIRLPQPVSSA
ncbi:sensor histidine kinase [Desulfonatronum thioautotrophicum]|uniref:sensor histidine kinase n=1 Tax=Desulfonatronum thioautotrophicum TaxID=617001 RepID=UPI00069C5AED|nr:PAS domain-containing protein [Desulfonatronum thioautotrophicum]